MPKCWVLGVGIVCLALLSACNSKDKEPDSSTSPDDRQQNGDPDRDDDTGSGPDPGNPVKPPPEEDPDPPPDTDPPPSEPNPEFTAIETSPIAFSQYGLASGFSYSYGFSIYDYDADGKPDVSFFDSWVYSRAAIRKSPSVIGYMMWNSGERHTIVKDEVFEYARAQNPYVYLFERHIPVDVNNDGWMDIVGVVNSHDSVIAYLNPGTTVDPWSRQVLNRSTPGVVNLTAADIDGDGDTDLFVTMRVQTTSYPGPRQGVAWLEQSALSPIRWRYHTIDTSDNFYDTRTVEAGDIDRDGKIDVLVSDSGTGRLTWFTRPGDPSEWQRNDIDGVNTQMAHFSKLKDFDHDGEIDVIAAHQRGISWVRNEGSGASWKINPIAKFPPDWNLFITEVVTGDIDLDGKDDIIFTAGEFNVGTHHKGGVYWAREDQGVWHVYVVSTNPHSRLVGVQVVDFDGDGDLDIISNTEYEANGVTLWINRLQD